jgi:hypothetical protein
VAAEVVLHWLLPVASEELLFVRRDCTHRQRQVERSPGSDKYT